MGGNDKNSFAKNYLPIHRQELLARKMHTFLHQLNTDVKLEEMRQQSLMQAVNGNQDMLASTPSIWPTEGWVTSPFGRRISPFTGQSEMHTGIDISGKIGTPIKAPAQRCGSPSPAWTAATATPSCSKHGAGVDTRYAHLNKIAVKEGDPVKRGDIIGYLGNSGRSTGPHLHYEVRLNGVSVNPMRYILN